MATKRNTIRNLSPPATATVTATGTAKVIVACLILSVCMQSICISASAIPIWEFLTRNEKMSYLYSTFAQLVSVHCKATASTSAVPVNQCKRNLLSYGYERLQTFSDAQLDILDPYQGGASDLIWSSIMRDHASSTLITTRKPLPTPPPSSIIILTHQKPINSEAPAPHASASSPTIQTQYPKNPLFDTEGENKHQYAMDMDIAYGYPGMNSQPNPQVETFLGSATPPQPQRKQTFLTGPMVFRVRPDGTPIVEDQYRPLPRDDDLESFPARNPNSNNNNTPSTTATASSGKHRKIATISALKQQHLATLALQQQLQPPHAEPRVRRQFHLASNPLSVATRSIAAGGGYHYGKGQA